jgi:hypothetical protein
MFDEQKTLIWWIDVKPTMILLKRKAFGPSLSISIAIDGHD